MTRKTPPKTTPGKGRTAPKRVSRRSYTEAEKLAAVALIRGNGLAATHAALGIPKQTLSRWAKAAGVDLEGPARARTRAASAAVEAKAAEVRLTTVDRLERILEQQLELEELIGELELKAGRELRNALLTIESTITGSRYVPTGAAAEELGRLRALLEVTPKRDAVGARTRSVHDLNLLKGEATERGAIVVRFGIPRPDASAADAQAIDEADLGAAP